MSDAIGWYDAHAPDLVAAYEDVDPGVLHGWLKGVMHEAPAAVLDVGAGTGRDAAWFASQGYDVVAVEPSLAMREIARSRHPDPRIQWLDCRLPELGPLVSLGLQFDLVMVNAVWQHVPPTQRERAFRKLAGLVKSGGLLTVTLRQGPADEVRDMHPVSLPELEQLAQNRGFAIEKVHAAPDEQGRRQIHWTSVALRLPDDGTGALPLLRNIILNDQKSATYKLALLRALCRIADGAAGISTRSNDEFVTVPLGAVALNWLRLYLPLVRGGLPQSPVNVGTAGLGFAKQGFEALLGKVSAADLRIGARFTGERASAVHHALRDIAATIDQMPSKFITHASGERILPVARNRVAAAPLNLELNRVYLEQFGTMRVPTAMWQAMSRNAAWIEPTLVAEWKRLIRDYANRQERLIREEALTQALRWSDPERDVAQARKCAQLALAAGELCCAWTGRRLTPSTLDIDHMFPWTAWPCSDLWNLLPSHRHVNQRQKRNRLPSASLLTAAQERIQTWWTEAYLTRATASTSSQFWVEAQATLPALTTLSTADVFESVGLQRIRLSHDQRIPEWSGT